MGDLLLNLKINGGNAVKKKALLLWMILITAHLNAQSYDMKISIKDGSQITVATETITKMTFALDQTHALFVSQKDGSQIQSNITNISRITFSEKTRVQESELRSEINARTFILRQNYPNPFNPSTTIEYELPAPGWINIQIFNVNGQLVRNLEYRYCPGGVHRIVWNGENDYRELVANGIYFYQVQFNNIVQMKKLLLVR
jgi:flagellar hook assembly protein FlgD